MAFRIKAEIIITEGRPLICKIDGASTEDHTRKEENFGRVVTAGIHAVIAHLCGGVVGAWEKQHTGGEPILEREPELVSDPHDVPYFGPVEDPLPPRL